MRKLKTAAAAATLLILSGCGLLALTPPKGLTDQQARGWEIYTRRCAACHRIKNKGGGSARELTHIAKFRKRAWLKKWINDPKSIFPEGKMPPTNLSKKQQEDLLAYLMTLK